MRAHSLVATSLINRKKSFWRRESRNAPFLCY